MLLFLLNCCLVSIESKWLWKFLYITEKLSTSQIMGHGPFYYEKTLGTGLTQVLFSVFTRHLGNIIIRTYIVEKAAAVYVMLNDFDVL